MGNQEVKATTQNTERADINYPPPAAALKIIYEGTQLKVFNLETLKQAG